MIENVIQIKSRTTINADASAKTQVNIMCAKNIYISEILVHVLVKMLDI